MAGRLLRFLEAPRRGFAAAFSDAPRRRAIAAMLLPHAAVWLGFAVLTVAMTWPLARHLRTHVVNAKWYYDAMVNMHILGSRMDYALGASPGLKSIYDNYFCAPTPFSIANNENHFGLTLLYAPFYLVTRNPLLSYNLLLLLCISLSGFFTYIFVRELTGSALAGVLSGVAYAFSPYIFFELGRVQLVAAQWIPLFALFLHRSATTGRASSLIALALTFAMQVGCCMYYAVFLGVYGAFVGTWLLIRHRPAARPFALRAAVAAAIAAPPIAFMVYPYFKARHDFALTRTEELAGQYAGRLQDFAKVYTENKALKFLHNGAPEWLEPIAFPGFTLALLAAIALIAPMIGTFRREDKATRRVHLQSLALAVAGAAAAVGLSLQLHNLVPGIAIILLGTIGWRLWRKPRLLPPTTFMYSSLLVVVVLLFLGPAPFYKREPDWRVERAALQAEWRRGKPQLSAEAAANDPSLPHPPEPPHGSDIRGPYQYLYRHVPGLDGIRYVSRFEILIMLALVVLGGYGAKLVLRGSPRVRGTVFGVLLLSMLFELRNAPMSLAQLPNKRNLSPTYKWLARHPGPEPIAIMPSYTRGFNGARNDYMSLFSKRRTIDGKSSWMPPITYAWIFETRRFPRGTATRMLQMLGVKYVVLNNDEYLPPPRRDQILHWLDNHPTDYVRRFAWNGEYIYEVLKPTDTSVSLLATPALPAGVRPIDRHELASRSSVFAQFSGKAYDGNFDSRWRTHRNQLAGEWFEFVLAKQHKIAALEFKHYHDPFEAPSAFRVDIAGPDGVYQTVFVRPKLRFYSDQVYHPKSFVFRIVLPQPMLGRAVRISLLDGVAGQEWAIHEAALWALD
jgi:hypothetical protein